MVSAGAYLPPDLQQAWEDLGHRRPPGLRRDRVRARLGQHRARPSRGRGRPDAAPGAACGSTPRPPRSQVAGPTVTPGYWRRPGGDGGRHRPRRLVPHGRHRAYRRPRAGLVLSGPHEEHHRAAQRAQRLPRGHRGGARGPRHLAGGGARDGARAHRGGRAAAGHACPSWRPAGAARRSATPRPMPGCGRTSSASCATSTRSLGTHQRIDAWRLWPEPDFPRTHTLKIRRDDVRAWAAVDIPLQVRDSAT